MHRKARTTGRATGSQRDRSQRGAALVEMAMVTPLFVLLLFGIIEAGWFFGQHIEVSNAAREGARLAVVDYPGPDFGDSAEIRDAVCERASLSTAGATVAVSQATDTNGGSVAVVTVAKPYSSLTGITTAFDGTIDQTVTMRIERETVTWSDLAASSCP